MSIENVRSAIRTPAGCNVPLGIGSTTVVDEHCAPLGRLTPIACWTTIRFLTGRS